MEGGFDFKKLIGSVILCSLAGAFGSVFTRTSITNWYAYLNKPILAPPNWVFGPVWTVLYLMMAVSLYLIWKRAAGEQRTRAIRVFIVQLVLNASWSAVFFGLWSIIGGLLVIVILWLSILWTIYEFRKLSRLAAWLLVPYLLWVSYASILNYYIWKLNQ